MGCTVSYHRNASLDFFFSHPVLLDGYVYTSCMYSADTYMYGVRWLYMLLDEYPHFYVCIIVCMRVEVETKVMVYYV